MPPNQALDISAVSQLQHDPPHSASSSKIRVALLGCGMMGQEHISYISGYSDLRIDFLCDPHVPSLEKSMKVMREFNHKKHQSSSSSFLPTSDNDNDDHHPMQLQSEEELLQYADNIDLLVMAHPNYLHTPSLLKWGTKDLTILVEKPVAVSQQQIDQLRSLQKEHNLSARIWVAMEYRYIPAIAKLLSIMQQRDDEGIVGDIKQVTIRENRYPFLHKIGDWNRDRAKTGDTLVEKCCHFFDLFRLLTGKEANLDQVRALAQRGINYGDEELQHEEPILDSAYVTLPFLNNNNNDDEAPSKGTGTIGCLELCMFAEGSRHQEEIIVTGTKGRLEAYLPENKVYVFQRPDHSLWRDRSVPPPKHSVQQHSQIIDCSNLKDVFKGISGDLPTHGGYHYSSTSVEWYHLIQEMHRHRSGQGQTGTFAPHVSLQDGIEAVQIGLTATENIVNEL